MPLPQPIGAQIDVLGLKSEGHFVILGTAGSGKTTIAIHRTLHLSKLLVGSGENHRVLLLTYNNSLIRYFEFLADRIPVNVHIRTYHKFGKGYLASRGIVTYSNILKRDGKEGLINEAADCLQARYPGADLFEKSIDFLFEEVSWIQKMGFNSLEEYKKTSRVGRGAAKLRKGDRDRIYEIYLKYLDIRAERGYVCDWEDMGTLVYETFLEDAGKRMYKHIIIDEGQDFSPAMIRSITQAIPVNGSLTYFGDVAQQIYGSRISWRDAGINIEGRIHRFEHNYRNSSEISKFAIAISSLPFYNKNEDMVLPKNVVAKGPKPAIAKFNSKEDEIQWIKKTSKQLSENGSVAILVRNNQLERKIRSAIGVNNCNQIEKRMRYVESGIWTGTYHAAKGLEFNTVIMPFCSSSILPDPSRINTLGGEEEALSEEAKLVYVGVTRAKLNLVITFHDELSQLIPTDDDLVTKHGF